MTRREELERHYFDYPNRVLIINLTLKVEKLRDALIKANGQLRPSMDAETNAAHELAEQTLADTK